MSKPSAELEEAWRSTCRTVLGGEVGGLYEFENWLLEDHGPRMVRPSCLSGKDVVSVYSNYPKAVRMASYDELDLNAQYGPLSINEIKDIDSLAEAVSERAIYCGNIVLGNSKFVQDSTVITDCFHTHHCERVAFSKFAAYCSRGGYSDYLFGCHGMGPVHYCIRTSATWDCMRSLMLSKSEFSSDCYYSHGLTGCQECLFSFHLKNQRRRIGNLALPKDQYLQIKAKLLEEMRTELSEKKRLPSLVEMTANRKPDHSKLKAVMALPEWGKWKAEAEDQSKIEEAFGQTSQVLLGKRMGPVGAYAKLLGSNSAVHMEKAKSCASGEELWRVDYSNFMSFPPERLLTQPQADFFGEHAALGEEEVKGLSLRTAPALIGPLAYFCHTWRTGKLSNDIEAPLAIDSSDCYHGVLFMLSKSCAYCLMPRSCEFLFGCREARESSFGINCHFSTKVSRCFELDNCNNCSDCFFCHNIENCQECMFCFNIKAKRYAIGNVEYPREQYLRVKKMVLAELASRLEKDKVLPWSIYSLGGKKISPLTC
ncbi:Uncharacterised protein [uncultured archaeon]|nr:Uncharacterised protein [uncultured archaeon]